MLAPPVKSSGITGYGWLANHRVGACRAPCGLVMQNTRYTKPCDQPLMATDVITAERVRQLLAYDPITGALTWRANARKGQHAGWIENIRNKDGTVTRRRVVEIEDRRYWATRLIWLSVTGAWPSAVVDHRDGATLNDAWSNLRDVSNQINSQNIRQPTRVNTSGFLGVHWSRARNKWIAQIKVDMRKVYLGGFPTAELASQAYIEAKRRMHPGCTI